MKKIFRNVTAIIFILTLSTKGINFIKEILIANRFGVSLELDSYLIATTIPIIVTGMIASAINTSLVPMYSKIKNKKEMFTLNNKIVTLMGTLMGIVFIICFIKPDIIVNLIAPNLSVEAIKLTEILFRINSISIILITIIYTYIALLNVNGNLIIATIINCVINVPITIYLLIVKNCNIETLAFYNTLGVILQLIIVIISLKRIRYKEQLDFKFKDEKVKDIMKISMPIFISNGVFQINVIIDRMLASGLRVGSISALGYAERLNNIITSLIVQPLILITYPIISKLFAKGDKKRFFEEIKNIIIFISLIMIPFSLMVIIFSEEIITVIYGRGQFDQSAIEITKDIMFFVSIGTFFVSLKELLLRVYYAMERVKYVTINSFICVGLNIILNLSLVRYLEAGGLALATSLSSIISVILLVWKLKKDNTEFEIIRILKCLSKITVIAIICIVLSRYIYLFKISEVVIINLIIAMIVMIVSYISLIFIFAKENIIIIKNIISLGNKKEKVIEKVNL